MRFLWIWLAMMAATALAAYGFFVWYYKNTAGPGLWVNGIYATGMDKDTLEEALLAAAPLPKVELLDGGRRVALFGLEEAGAYVEFGPALEELYAGEDSLLWPWRLGADRHMVLQPSIRYNEAKFLGIWSELPLVKRELAGSTALSLIPEEDGSYSLYEGNKHRLDLAAALDAVQSALASGVSSIDLAEADCYRDLPWTPRDAAVASMWKRLEALQESALAWDMGDGLYPIKGGDAVSMLDKGEDGLPYLGEDGLLALDVEAVEAFVRNWAALYDTLGQEREFLSTRGDVIRLKGGIYGTQLNQKAEVEYLLQAIPRGWEETRVPEYIHKTDVRGKDDIGKTYVEVDMSLQKLYYYQEGICLYETDIVTGNLAARHGTPQGVNYVYMKQKNRVLRGADYASFVKYWMPVKGNYGIHDASWRSKFGGEIYKTAGSHGCINVPPKTMGTLYDLVAVGTPVVMFY